MANSYTQPKAMVKENALSKLLVELQFGITQVCPLYQARWVLVRDPQNKFEPQALYQSSIFSHANLRVVCAPDRRWKLPLKKQEPTKGVETQRQWSDERNCPHNSDCVGIIFFGHSFERSNTQANFSWTVRQTIWYSLSLPTFIGCTCLSASVFMG